MTGGMAYEALNNLGHSGRKVIIVLNDNGRSYAADRRPNLSESLDASIRLNPVYVRRQRRLEEVLRGLPIVGRQAEKGVEAFKAAVREFVEPPVFFETLGVRYVGPVDGHDIEALEHAFRNATEFDEPIVVHVLTQKGRGYPPAEDDDEKHLHDAPVFDPRTGPPKAVPTGYTQAFAEAILKEAELDPRLVAITAAMPGPTGLIPFQDRFPDRFFDVGIAEQHAVTAAAGMAMGGLRPVVAIYSTFLNRAWDQVVYDVALHRLPVVFCLDRAGITGDDGPSHHGVLRHGPAHEGARHDGVRAVVGPGAAGHAPRRPRAAATGPAAIRCPKGQARQVEPTTRSASGLHARKRPRRRRPVCLLAVGKMVAAPRRRPPRWPTSGIDATVWDVRVVKPARPGRCSTTPRATAWSSPSRTASATAASARSSPTSSPTCCAGRTKPRVEILGVPVQFIPHGKPDRILADLGPRRRRHRRHRRRRDRATAAD